MKTNLPVTENEVVLAEGEEIISTTDLKGCITSVNDLFVRISGFSREELLGKSHNIVRHPDMPAAAFQNLWDDMKAGKQWMGIVKNRCKNGDFYWVDAFVTPIVENGTTVGYESVRVVAKKEDRQRAEQLYNSINIGKSNPFKKILSIKLSLFLVVALTVLSICAVAVLGGASITPIAIMACVLLAVSYCVIGFILSQLDRMAEKSKVIADNLVIQYMYTGRTDSLGQLMFANAMLEARLRTVVGRMSGSFDVIEEFVADLDVTSKKTFDGVVVQQLETNSVLGAISEMSLAVLDVASNASNTSKVASNGSERVNKAQAELSNTIDAMTVLAASMSVSNDVIARLESDSDEINKVLEVIVEIADQTNLLALNAAIEAARAGEHGRGFAVVADEVRSLSQRTRVSTVDIQKIVEKLQQNSQKAMETMQKGVKQSDETVSRAQIASTSLNSVVMLIGEIEQMSINIAAAVEQQSLVSETIKGSVENINTLAGQNAEHSKNSSNTTVELLSKAVEVNNMALRFKKAC